MRPHRPNHTIIALVLVGALTLAFAGVVPAMAHHKPDHTGGSPTSMSGGGSDQDGDADSNPATAVEDSHSPDPSPDTDNQHPSGKDRSGENGGSGNQGKSESDPDGGENGGIDKPGGTATASGDLDDQDGNNGCGNDDDFEDDNNGNCGPKAGGNGGNGGDGANGTSDGLTAGGAVQAEVLGEAVTKPGKAQRAKARPAVAGERELAFTGADDTPLLWTTALLFVGGLVLLTVGRRRANLAEDRHGG
jgi:hypothetical protein